MFTQGTQAIYVELSDSNGRKRYLLPNEPTTMSKLHQVLTKYPQIGLVRQGMAQVKSAPDKSEIHDILDIEHMPIKVDALYKVFMADHPDTVENFARYSEDLIKLINESEVSTMEVVAPSTEPVSPSLADSLRSQLKPAAVELSSSAPSSGANLTESLKAQVQENKERQRPHSRPQAPASSAPVSDISEARGARNMAAGMAALAGAVISRQGGEDEALDGLEYEDYVCKYLEELYEMTLTLQDSIDRIDDKVDVIAIATRAPKAENGEAVTGEQLSKWFAEAAAQVGFDKAFEVLALRLAGENPEV